MVEYPISELSDCVVAIVDSDALSHLSGHTRESLLERCSSSALPEPGVIVSREDGDPEPEVEFSYYAARCYWSPVAFDVALCLTHLTQLFGVQQSLPVIPVRRTEVATQCIVESVTQRNLDCIQRAVQGFVDRHIPKIVDDGIEVVGCSRGAITL